MRTSPHPAHTPDNDLAALLQGLLGPTPAARMWSVSYDGPGVRIFCDAFSAAKFITTESRRGVKAGQAGMLTVASLDDRMATTADASAEVLEALINTSWLTSAHDSSYATIYRLRDQVIDIVETILLRSN